MVKVVYVMIPLLHQLHISQTKTHTCSYKAVLSDLSELDSFVEGLQQTV